MDPFERAVLRSLQSSRLLPAGGRVIAAVSAGPDSTGLLRVLHALSARLDLRLFAFHLNHRLRARDSEEDEEFVRALASQLDIELRVESCDASKEAAQRGLNLEDCARRIRYRSLLRWAWELEARAATGHTRDDRVETLIMKLSRGAGLEGLGTIYPRWRPRDRIEGRPGPEVVRPLLEFSGIQVREYLERIGQGFRADRSNQDLSFDRNWVREELIPLMRRRLNPRLDEALGRAADVLSQTQQYMDSKTQQASDAVVRQCRDDLLVSIPALLEQAPIVQRELLRRAIQAARRPDEPNSRGESLRDWERLLVWARSRANSAQIEQILSILERPGGGEAALAGGLRAVREFDDLRLTFKPRVAPFSYAIEAPAQLRVREAAKILSIREVSAQSRSPHPRIRLADRRLTVRNRRPGDRLRVCDDSEPQKLKRLFWRFRIPSSLRDSLLILQDSQGILWVEGLPVDPADGPGPGRCYEIRVVPIAADPDSPAST